MTRSWSKFISEIGEIVKLSGGKPKWASFGLSDAADYRFSEGVVRSRDGRITVSVAGTLFDNSVMGVTAAAAVAAILGAGADPECVGRAARSFEPLPHRMNVVDTIKGIVFVDDSKATNLAAMAAALDMSRVPVRLIAGGQLKEKDLALPGKQIESKVRGLYLVGDAARDMKRAWGAIVPCKPCGTLDNAVATAWRDAVPGDTILLSPGCASFDQFKSFEDRGKQFREMVKRINKEMV